MTFRLRSAEASQAPALGHPTTGSRVPSSSPSSQPTPICGPETQEARDGLRDFIVSGLDRPSSESTADERWIEAVQDKV